MRRSLTIVACLALTLAACDAAGDEQASPEPTVTVTVTETATPSEPTASPTAMPTQAGAICESLDPMAAEFAFIVVESPLPGTSFSSGDEVSGCGNTFEAAYQWELLDGQEQLLADGFGTMTCGNGCVGTYTFSPNFSVTQQQMGTLRVFETSARDGSEVHVNAIPVLLTP